MIRNLWAQWQFYRLKKHPFRVSTTFSIPYCEWLGLDWEDCLQAILELPLHSIRLTIPWDRVEPEKNKWQFTEIEKAISLCAKKNIPVILCLGAKNPRWPELQVPEYVAKKLEKEGIPQSLKDSFGPDLKSYLTKCLKKYGQNGRIRSIQVENEPFEPVGPAQYIVPVNLLKEEVTLAKKLTDKPIWLTMGAGLTEPAKQARKIRFTMLKKLVSLPVEAIGLNMYQKGYFAQENNKIVGFNATEESWLIARQLGLVAKAHGCEPFISELQSEPWEAYPSKMNLIDPRANKSFTPEIYLAIMEKASRVGGEEVFLWGLEWQYACKKQNNPVFWEITKERSVN